MSNTGPAGNLNQDSFLQAILQLRNPPDHDCSLSPAEIIFGRPLRDFLSFVNRLEKYSNPHIRSLWRDAWSAKEEALRTGISKTTENLKLHSRPLKPLAVGDKVHLQNQRGPHPTKWDRLGLVIESLGNDQYRVKVDGSGKLTLWNRRFLRAYTPLATDLPQAAYIPFATEPPSVTYEPVTATPSAPRSQEIPKPSEVHTDSIPLLQPALQPVTEDLHQGSPTAVTPLPDRVDVPAPTMSGQENQSPPPTIPHTRPTRQRQPPKRYEPETGK
eukprot:gene861-153_t